MSVFKTAWKITGRHEGGFVDDPRDSGGATNHGITEKVARQFGYRGAMRDLPESTALAIAKSAYWDTMKLDSVAAVSPRVALEVFDTGFNAGPRTAVRILQRSLNAFNNTGNGDLVEDGYIGRATFRALRAYFKKRKAQGGETVLLRALNGLQCAYYIDLADRRPKDRAFTYGWVKNRVQI